MAEKDGGNAEIINRVYLQLNVFIRIAAPDLETDHVAALDLETEWTAAPDLESGQPHPI